jgi:hypothetical protein
MRGSRMRLAAVAALTALVLAAGVAAQARPQAVASAAASCEDHADQASAQRAKDTRDADGDGIYCESLPCPCLPPDPRAGSDGDETPPRDEESDRHDGCDRPHGVQRLTFDASEYPNIRRHFRSAVRGGWPRRLVLNRRGADARRDRLLEHYPTREGKDRDEYPPAVGRGRGKGLTRGRNPRGWKASVRYVPSSENRSHGASLGNQLEGYCNGTSFRYVFR